MQIRHEHINYKNYQKVWIGKYLNSQNLPHWHKDCELLYVDKGKLRVMCDRKNYEISEGQTFFIGSEQLHYISAEDKSSILTTFFFTDEIIKPFADGLTLVNPVVEGDYGILKVYEKLKREFEDQKKFFELSIKITVSELMLEIFRNEQFCPKETGVQTTQTFKKLIASIENGYEFYTFEDAADFMGMNPSYFSRYFHEMAGMTFTHFLNFIKVKKAIEMLQNEKYAVTDVAMMCGFSTIRSFNRVFKQFTEYTPTAIPGNFILEEALSRTDYTDGNPTLSGCSIIESYS